MRPTPVYKNFDLLRFIFCAPFFVMTTMLVIEAALAATTTWLIIQAGQDIAADSFKMMDFVWIVVVQATSYIIGMISWVFAERAGFGAFGRYMMRFARDNKGRTALLNDKHAREISEPFLTSETFHIFFEMMYELESDLKLFFGLLFNSIVLGVAIDAGLPIAYAIVLAILLTMQYLLRKPVANAYLENQRATNRMTAHNYTAWDNIMSGNPYNFRLWHAGFKQRLRAALKAQIRAILAREGLSTISGIISLGVVFSVLAWVVWRDTSNTGLLIALAATLPRQIEMSHDVHHLASGWNDLVAVWTRLGGACQSMVPETDLAIEKRIKFNGLRLKENDTTLPCANLDDALALAHIHTGRVNVRGDNGAGKSTLLAALKMRLGAQAYYWPTTDRLAFDFSKGEKRAEELELEEEDEAENSSAPQKTLEHSARGENGTSTGNSAGNLSENLALANSLNPALTPKKIGFSSGERQIKSLQEIVRHTRAKVYLLDEWDANLDAQNRAKAQSLVDELAARARVIEISHRDKA